MPDLRLDKSPSHPRRFAASADNYLATSTPRRKRVIAQQEVKQGVSLISFHRAEISFVKIRSRKLNALTEGIPGGFLDSTRQLTISNMLDASSSHVFGQSRQSLLRLLCAPPRDSLTAFNCPIQLYQHTIGLLLQI
jgi:hypothetical protein